MPAEAKAVALVDAAALRPLVARIFAAAGSNATEAGQIADHLVDSNLVGHDSHGVIRIREYLPWVKQGRLKPNATPKVMHETDVLAVIDGDQGYGQVIGVAAVEHGLAKAKRHGLAMIGVRNTGHVGRLGQWAEQAAEQGVVSLHFVNTSGFGILVAPHGGSQARLSANPMAAGVPRPDGRHIIYDIATAAIAGGKIKVAGAAGKLLPEGTVLDAQGRPTRDPKAFFGPPQGAILPFGGHKGYGLSVIIDVLAGAVTGGMCSNPANPNANRLVNNMLSLFIAPTAMTDRAFFDAQVTGLEAWIKSSAPAADATGPILLPGEVERQTRAERLAKGIPLDAGTRADVVAQAAAVGVDAATLLG